MPIIPELRRAYDNRSEVLSDPKAVSLQEEIATLRDRLADRTAQLEALKAPAAAQVKEALELQDRTLTRWVRRSDSFNRYKLRQSGPTNLAWDSRAWLRRRSYDQPLGWRWTLDLKGFPGVHNQSIQIANFLPNVDDATAWESNEALYQAVCAAADTFIIAAGYLLTDLDNE